MPTYNYKCTSCNTIKEFTHKIYDDKPICTNKCCLKDSLVKIPNAVNVIYKGAGWFKKDGKY